MAAWPERDRTMQEETPLAPAQTITSLILLPQNLLHSALDTRGRAACCSLSGVLLAGGTGRGVRAPHAPAYPAWETPGASQRPCPGPAWSSSFALTTGAVWVLPATLWWAEGPCPHSREGGDALLTGDTGGDPPLLAAVREQPPPAAPSWQLLSC